MHSIYSVNFKCMYIYVLHYAGSYWIWPSADRSRSGLALWRLSDQCGFRIDGSALCQGSRKVRHNQFCNHFKRNRFTKKYIYAEAKANGFVSARTMSCNRTRACKRRTLPNGFRIPSTKRDPNTMTLRCCVWRRRLRSTLTFGRPACAPMPRCRGRLRWPRDSDVWNMVRSYGRRIVDRNWKKTRRKNSDQATTSAELMKVQLSNVDKTICDETYRSMKSMHDGVIESQFCAGELAGKKDTCQGDSGGPLQVIA